MKFSLIILLSLVLLTTQSKLKTLISSRQLANNMTLTNGNVTVRTPPANTTGLLIGWAPPIPLSPTVHPLFPSGGRPRGESLNNTLTNNNNTITPIPSNFTGNYTEVPERVPIPPNIGPVAVAAIPLIPAALTMLPTESKNIPVNYWVSAGNKTYIVLRTESDLYIKCENGNVSGLTRSGNMSEIPTTYLWEPEFLNNTNINFKTYDGNYLNYIDYKFSCSSKDIPNESYTINRGSYLTGGPTEDRTDYLVFQRGIFNLGLQDDQVKLLEQGNINSRFVPIFNRTLPDNPLPSS
jgi:hypothetical protein